MSAVLMDAANRARTARAHLVVTTCADQSRVSLAPDAPTWLRAAVARAHDGHHDDALIHLRAAGVLQWACTILPTLDGDLARARADLPTLAHECAQDLIGGEISPGEALDWLRSASWRLGYVRGMRGAPAGGDTLDELVALAMMTEATEVSQIMLDALLADHQPVDAPPVPEYPMAPQSLIDTMFGSEGVR